MREVKPGSGTALVDESGGVAELRCASGVTRITVNGRPVSRHGPGVYGGDWCETVECIRRPFVEIAVGVADELGIEGDLRLEPTSLLPKR